MTSKHKWWHGLPLGDTERIYHQKTTDTMRGPSRPRRYTGRIDKCWRCKEWAASITLHHEMECHEISWAPREEVLTFLKKYGCEDFI